MCSACTLFLLLVGGGDGGGDGDSSFLCVERVDMEIDAQDCIISPR